MSPATLARGRSSELIPIFEQTQLRASLWKAILTIILGAGCYGFTVGLWRGLEMAAYVAFKTPLLLFLTLSITGFLNGLIALLFGTGIGFRQSLLCQLLAFALASTFLASLAPVTFFMALEITPSIDKSSAIRSHSVYLLTHTSIIGLGGFLAVIRLFDLIRELTPNQQASQITLLAWLISNAFVGAQLSFLMRPFFGSPNLKIELFRDDLFNGTFYEAIWDSLSRIVSTPGAILVLSLLAAILTLLIKKTIHPSIQ